MGRDRLMRAAAYLCLLTVTALGGCAVFETGHSTSWLKRSRPAAAPLPPDIVQMDLPMIERPVGDRYLNQELWANTDEQIVGPEYKAAVDDNGFRVGQIIGIPPGRLQALLTSPRSC